MRAPVLLVLSFLAFGVSAQTPYSVALLTQERDEAVAAESLQAALRSGVPLVRATAARVIAVRGATALLPGLREQLEAETDAMAAREVIRAMGLLGTKEDIAAAARVSSRWPVSMDDALAAAVARRGGTNALESYGAVLRATRMRNHSEFFRLSLWGVPNFIGYAGSRMLATSDEAGWRGLVEALEYSNIALDSGVLTSSLDTEAEAIRSASVWYLIRGYSADPAAVPALVREKLAAPRGELSSNREDFGRELLRRMLGGEKKNDQRWLTFLAGDEADALLGDDETTLQYLTEEEYAVRYNRCEVRSRDCILPPKRSRSTRTIPSQAVAPPAFNLPEVLPAGLADAIVTGARCDAAWVGVAGATVDSAGRIRTLDLEPVGASAACKRALETLLRVSYASNTSLRSPLTGAVLLVHGRRAPLCLDEPPPSTEITSTFRTGGNVQTPKVKKRVEPQFPASALNAMGNARNVLVIIESVITKEGCVRSMRLLKQSPFPELNGAALLALSKWQFTPGYLDGKPVDVIFNLTVNFKTN
ncbi:MAG TPA: TonB family protein [Thermoanaerobaculia bacterium]